MLDNIIKSDIIKVIVNAFTFRERKKVFKNKRRIFMKN